MVPENLPILQVEVVIADELRSPHRIIKGGIQMVVPSAYPHNIPGMAVLNPLLRGILRDDHDAPQPQLVAQGLHRLGNSLAHPHPLAQGAQNFVGIGLFQLVVVYLGANKVVDIPLLLPLGQSLGGTGQPLHPGAQRLLVLPDAPLVKEVLGTKFHPKGIGVDPAGESSHVEYLRAVQTQVKQHVSQLLHVQTGHGEYRAQSLHAPLDGVIGLLHGFAQSLIVVGLHSISFSNCKRKNPRRRTAPRILSL